MPMKDEITTMEKYRSDILLIATQETETKKL